MLRLRTALLSAAVAGLLANSVTAQNKQDNSAGERPLAVLNSAEWTDLFNGKDLSLWQGDTKGYTADCALTH